MSSSGLFSREWFFSSDPEMEMESMTVNVTIQDFVADVVSEMFFRNKQQISMEIMFLFPVDSDTVVHTFHATMGNTRVEAMLCDKKEVLQLSQGEVGCTWS